MTSSSVTAKKMTDIKSIIEQVAETNITVLVRGGRDRQGAGTEGYTCSIPAP